MPCQSDYLKHNEREAESGRVREFLKEIDGKPFDHDNPSYYGEVERLDEDTAELCDWCKKNEPSMQMMSLELQLWWQRHKRADQKRKDDRIALREAVRQQSIRAIRNMLREMTPAEQDELLEELRAVK